MGPSRPLKAFFDAPAWLYRHNLGGVLGRRFLAVSHQGRRSGREYETVLEVIVYDHAADESVVVSAYGTEADWFRNIKAQPAHRVKIGRAEFVPHQRFLDAAEATAAAERFCGDHRFEAWLMPRVLPAIGAPVPEKRPTDPVGLLASLPMVAFRPAR